MTVRRGSPAQRRDVRCRSSRIPVASARQLEAPPKPIRRFVEIDRALALGVFAIGLVTTLFRLTDRGLWGDEVWEVAWTRYSSLAGTFWRFRTPPDLSLHFLLVQASTKVSDNEFWARLPSVLLGALTVLGVFL